MKVDDINNKPSDIICALPLATINHTKRKLKLTKLNNRTANSYRSEPNSFVNKNSNPNNTVYTHQSFKQSPREVYKSMPLHDYNEEDFIKMNPKLQNPSITQ